MFGLLIRSQRLRYVYLFKGKTHWRVRGRRNRMGVWVGWGVGYNRIDRTFSVGQEEHLFPELGRHVKVDLPYFDD